MLTEIAHGTLLELRLERPPVSALDPELIAALGRAVAAAPDRGVRALVLSGREGMFSAGLDVPRFLALDRGGVRKAWASFFLLMKSMASSPIPIAAALTGHAPAGGCVLALFCDWRVMAEGNFKIGLNEVQVGLPIPAPIYGACAHVVGARLAERMCTTAALMSAEEAHRIGLVDELVPASMVVPRALAWCEKLLELPPTALRKTRSLARAPLRAPFADLDEIAQERFLDDWFSLETQTALKALANRLSKKP